MNMDASMTDVSQLLRAFDKDEAHASEQLLPLVYEELRKLAVARLSTEPSGNTLQPTALVHEAYLRLVQGSGADHWDHRGHFFAAAAEAMRRILVEAARRKRGPERGGHLKRHELNLEQPADLDRSERLLDLDDALERLAMIEPRAAEVVKLRYFVGLTITEVAMALDISPRTADADWAYARAWLVTALRDE